MSSAIENWQLTFNEVFADLLINVNTEKVVVTSVGNRPLFEVRKLGHIHLLQHSKLGDFTVKDIGENATVSTIYYLDRYKKALSFEYNSELFIANLDTPSKAKFLKGGRKPTAGLTIFSGSDEKTYLCFLFDFDNGDKNIYWELTKVEQ